MNTVPPRWQHRVIWGFAVTRGTEVITARMNRLRTGIGFLCTPTYEHAQSSPAVLATGDRLAAESHRSRPQHGIAEGVHALAAKTLPDLRRSVNWSSR